MIFVLGYSVLHYTLFSLTNIFVQGLNEKCFFKTSTSLILKVLKKHLFY